MSNSFISFESIFQPSIIPVLVLRDLDSVIPVAEVLIENGLPVIEVTLRTDIALASIKLMSESFPEAIVGAGTVCSPDNLISASDSGAAFVVSPGASESMYEAVIDSNLPFLPGVSTPSEIMFAREYGYKVCKFFPAEGSRGINILRMYRDVFPDIAFCPTGGVNEENLLDYLSLENVLAVAGSWIAPDSLVMVKDWHEIEQRAQHARKLVDRSLQE